MNQETEGLELPPILARGVEQILPNAQSLAQLMANQKIRVYLGIDPTGNLLTLGHSVVLRKLQQFAQAGHQVILLIGNGTVKIGDPTGKDTTRPELTDQQIIENFQTWKEQASKILDFNLIEIRYNGDWLDKLTYAEIVKLMAKTTVQQLIERDMFQERMKAGRPIYGHEIMYPLLQGYDSVVMDIDLEIGGTDQTFNMMMGRTLQRAYNNKDKWVLTTPIIDGTDGRKMSKSYGNFVALTDTPQDMYGKLMSIADTQIIPYFELLTDEPLENITQMKTDMKSGNNPMEYKKRLAHTITAFYHSSQDADMAQDYFARTVQNKEIPQDIAEVVLPTPRVSALELLQYCLPTESKANLRRLLLQKAVEITQSSNHTPTDAHQLLTLEDASVVRVGKRRFFRLRIKK